MNRVFLKELVGKKIVRVIVDYEVCLVFDDNTFCYLEGRGEAAIYDILDDADVADYRLRDWGLATDEEFKQLVERRKETNRKHEEDRLRAIHAEFLRAAPARAEAFIREQVNKLSELY